MQREIWPRQFPEQGLPIARTLLRRRHWLPNLIESLRYYFAYSLPHSALASGPVAEMFLRLINALITQGVFTHHLQSASDKQGVSTPIQNGRNLRL